MNYVMVSSEQAAVSLVSEVRAEGFNAYWQKLNADTFEVRYWK